MEIIFMWRIWDTSLEEFWVISCDRWRWRHTFPRDWTRLFCEDEEHLPHFMRWTLSQFLSWRWRSSDSCEEKPCLLIPQRYDRTSHIPVCVCVCVRVWTQMPDLQAIGISLHAFRSHWSTPAPILGQQLGGRSWSGGLLQPIWKICARQIGSWKTQGSGLKKKVWNHFDCCTQPVTRATCFDAGTKGLKPPPSDCFTPWKTNMTIETTTMNED